MQSRAFNRKMAFKKAKRKQRIAREVYYDGIIYPYYNNLHQYSKNKIHCSCPMCSPKSRNKGKRRSKPGNYSLSRNWKHSDLIKIESMEQKLREYFEEVPDGSPI